MVPPADHGTVLVGLTASPDATGLATRMALELTGAHPGPLHHHCPVCGSIEHGRPSFDAAVAVSIAHATGLTVVALSTAGPVGIDVEISADQEWVRAEAVGKAYGVGLTGPVGEALVEDLDIPGYVVALAVLAPDMPEVRMLAAGPEAPGSPAMP